MSRAPTKAAIARAVEAVMSIGLKVVRVEIDRDRIIVVSAEANEPPTALDAWRAKRDARAS